MEVFKRSLINLAGWKSRRRFLCIESDDWGAVRMASTGAFETLLGKGYNLQECAYSRYDTLETPDALGDLMDVLSNIRDANGGCAKITLNMIMANPNFDAIKRGRFEEYHYEPFWETLSHQSGPEVISAYREARSAGVAFPQLHGREHIAAARWLAALRNGHPEFIDAFREGVYALAMGTRESGSRDHLDALGFTPEDTEFSEVVESLRDAQRLFKTFWGEKAEAFIPPCYVWHPAIERGLSEIGIRFIQGTRVQRIPRANGEGRLRKRYHFTGQNNSLGQTYLVRNVELEPSLTGDETRVIDTALAQVRSAFRLNTPAIVSSHRLNYIGGLSPANRTRGLRVLRRFLKGVCREWPEIEFIDSASLGRMIEA